MICKPCAQAADALEAQLAKPGNVWPSSIATVKRLHLDYCPGCDCQHRVDLQAEGRSVRK